VPLALERADNPMQHDNMTPHEHVQASRVLKKLLPGRPGTKKLLRRYGDALLCVRYRHDRLKLYRFTTIELVVDAAPIHPKRFDLATFGLHINPHERSLRAVVRQAGARLDPVDQLWWLRGAIIRKLGLVHRVCTT
jgi:hypothetical protein